MLLVAVYGSRQCGAGDSGRAFVVLWTMAAATAVLLDALLMLLSLRGSVSDARPRALVAPLYAASIGLDLIQVIDRAVSRTCR